MKKLSKLIYIILTGTFLLTSCKLEDKNIITPYQNAIYTWYSSQYEQLNKKSESLKSDTWFLYFDEELVCDTCKLQILNAVKDMDNVVLLTHFGNEVKVELFKSTYKLNNIVFDGISKKGTSLSIPFLFRSRDKSMYALTIIDEEFLEKNSLKKILSEKL